MTETTTSRLISELRRLGIRVTAQRIAVAETLAGSTDHPTAPEVYERLQDRFPHITMATVYNTVNTLAKSGFIQLLSFPDGARYDANPTPHANLVCIRCQTIIDAPDIDDTVGRLREHVTAGNGFRVCHDRAAYGFAVTQVVLKGAFLAVRFPLPFGIDDAAIATVGQFAERGTGFTQPVPHSSSWTSAMPLSRSLVHTEPPRP